MSFNINGRYKIQGRKEGIFNDLTLIQFLKLIAELEKEGLHFSVDVNIEHLVE